MAEYIKRQDATDMFLVGKNTFAGFCTIEQAIENIESVEAADVVEVRHGEWVYHECVSSYDGAKSGFACSVCSGFVEEDIFDMDEFNKNFCGACGAKMDGKGD